MIEIEAPSVLVRVWLLGPFVVHCRKDDGTWHEIDQATWDKYSYGRPLLQRLLCSSRRRVERTTLIDDLWPRSDISASVERYPSDAAYHLRQILRISDIVKTYGNKSGYELQGQSVVWVDVDECEILLKEAERIGYTSAPALELLERAHEHFQRGGFLEGQPGQWCYARRATVERLAYRCHLWLAQAYEHQGMVGQAEIEYSRLLEEQPDDEDVLCLFISMLHRQGMTHQVRKCYEHIKQRLKQEGWQLSPATTTFIARILNSPRQIELSLTERIAQPFLPKDDERQAKSNSLPSLPEDIIDVQPGGSQSMNSLRRYLIQQTLGLTGATFVPTRQTPSTQLLLGRLSRALATPLSPDEKTIQYLEKRTYSYWQDRHRATLPSYDLLVYVSEHFEKIIALLEGSLLPSLRNHLCILASGTAQLLGEIFFDLNDVQNEMACKKIAIIAAQEANSPALEAVAWGRMCFVWTYHNNPQEALKCVQNARRLAAPHANAVVGSWLAAVEAEIQSLMYNSAGCLAALDATEHTEDPQCPLEDSYWLYFDRSLRAGYRGICFQRLSRLNKNREDEFLTCAQKSLQEALALLDPMVVQRRPTLLTDLAIACVQHEQLEEAYDYAVQAIALTKEMKSEANTQRLLSLCQLEPWKDLQYVRQLREHMNPLLALG